MTNRVARIWRKLFSKKQVSLDASFLANKSFCVLPWLHLETIPAGTAKICCVATQPISKDGIPMSVYEYTVEDIWNSDEMRSIRELMLEGKPVKQCAYCNRSEALGQQSMRTRHNTEWLEGDSAMITRLCEESYNNGYRVSQLPIYYQFSLGNLCNLACRMCNSTYSAKIDRDEIHGRWAPKDPGNGSILTQWQNDSLLIGPRPVVGVTYKGFQALTTYKYRDLSWTDGNAQIKLLVEEGIKLSGLQIKLAEIVQLGTRFSVSVNDRLVFSGRVKTAPWTCEIDISHLSLDSSVEVQIKSGSGRLPIEAVHLVRSNTFSAGKASGSKFTVTRFSNDAPWFDQPSLLFDEFFHDAKQIRKLYFTGGEPTLNRRLEEIIDFLNDAGSVEEIFIMFNSNGTIYNQQLLEKLKKFKAVLYGLSVDAFGKEYGYIRYPSSWEVVADNIDKLRIIDYINLSINPSIQALNVMTIVRLLKFCDERELRCDMSNIVFSPDHLTVLVLPSTARKIAAERLREYSSSPYSSFNEEANRQDSANLAKYLEGTLSSEPSEDLLRTFMLFTNDLDRKRNQSFKEVHREIYEIIASYGFEWTEETLFATVN